MKLVKPNVEWWGACPTGYPFEGLRRIERAARICYKSGDKITDDSAPKFISNIMKRNPPHLSVVEHSNAVFRWNPPPNPPYSVDGADIVLYAMLRQRRKFHDIKIINGVLYIGGNLRSWFETAQFIFDPLNEKARIVTGFYEKLMELYPIIFQGPYPDKLKKEQQINIEQNTLPFLEYVPYPPKEMQRYTVKWTCDRGVSHEIVRHRLCSFSQESTRYCDYNGKDMEFVEPAWWDDTPHGSIESDTFYENCEFTERCYTILRNIKQTPQQARASLTNALKTEIVITADLEEWNWIFNLRNTPAAHPDMQILAKATKDLFMENELIPWEEVK